MPRVDYRMEIETEPGSWLPIGDDLHGPTPVIVERGLVPGDPVAVPGTLTFALLDAQGRYTPGDPEQLAGFRVGAPVRLRAASRGTFAGLFLGRITRIRPGDGVTQVAAADAMGALERTTLGTFPLTFDAVPRDLVNVLVDRGFIAPEAAVFWQLDLVARLGTDTQLADTFTGKAFDEGQSVFPFVGDMWGPDWSLRRALQEVVASEGGQFFIAADGTPTFHDRHHRPARVGPDLTIDVGLTALEADWSAAGLANQVAITLYPREVGTGEVRLWQAATVLRLEPGVERALSARYTGEGDLRWIGALDVRAAIEVRTRRDPDKGKVATGDVTLELEAGASAARIRLFNRRDQVLYVHTLRLFGLPLRAFNPVTIAVADVDAQVATGRHPLRLDLRLLSDPAVAADRALGLLQRLADPQPRLTVEMEATVSNRGLLLGIGAEINQRLAISDPRLGPAPVGVFVDRIRHVITALGASHRVTWWTSPADPVTYWLLGEAGLGELGQMTRVGY
ncbi:MAG: hypothetical protein GYB64_13535 [Chloroflexi bacterium]|nr:hypothetical protein [Chloroflexota bacterium]